jgi:hypothetical protein
MGRSALRDLFPPLVLASAAAVMLLSAAMYGPRLAGLGEGGTPRTTRTSGSRRSPARASARAPIRSLASLPAGRGGAGGSRASSCYAWVGERSSGREGSARGIQANLTKPLLCSRITDRRVSSSSRPGIPGARGLAIAAALPRGSSRPCPASGTLGSRGRRAGLVAFLLCAKVGDTAAYYVGTAFGTPPTIPEISPGKTLEGCLGSFAAGAAAGGLCAATGLTAGGDSRRPLPRARS